jgi:hypothetical protein
MGSMLIPRATRFRWNSKNELYDYFRKYYELSQEDVDAEIERSMNNFVPRRGHAIKTMELWQKVGSNLEKTHDSIIDVPDDMSNYGLIDSMVINENNSEEVRKILTMSDSELLSAKGYSSGDFIFRKKKV